MAQKDINTKGAIAQIEHSNLSNNYYRNQIAAEEREETRKSLNRETLIFAVGILVLAVALIISFFIW